MDLDRAEAAADLFQTAGPYIGGGVVLLLLCFIGLYVIGQRKAANRKREADDRLKARAMLESQDAGADITAQTT